MYASARGGRLKHFYNLEEQKGYDHVFNLVANTSKISDGTSPSPRLLPTMSKGLSIELDEARLIIDKHLPTQSVVTLRLLQNQGYR